MCPTASCIDNAFGYSFMSEMRYLFPQNKVFPQRKCVVTGLERVVIVCKSHTLIVSAPLGEIRLLPGWSEITQTLVAS